MVVKIRFGQGPKVERTQRKNRRLALALSSLLTPGALMAAALGFWRLAADLNWTGDFAIASGIFSHWQVWLLSAGMMQLCAWLLNRYGRGGLDRMRES
jgi:hypothetical protein